MTAEAQQEPPAISLVVGTRNRSHSLRRLLSALGTQVGAPPFEVVVADNGSTDDTPGVIEDAARDLPVRSVRMELPGKGRALNAALRSATGNLVVFTDDDVVPDPQWLAELHSASLRHPTVGIFGGAIEVGAGEVPDWVRRSRNLMGLLASEHRWSDREDPYPYGMYPFGPNMAIRRSLIARIESPYPESMGPGTAIPVGDEGAFLVPLSPPGATNRLFVPSARVLHEVEAANVTFGEALRRSYFAGLAKAGSGMLMAAPAPGGERPSFVRRLIDQIRHCGSLREFACVGARQLGYRRGRKEAGR